jgi:hypothetical protein
MFFNKNSKPTSTDSFMIELQQTDLAQIFGGGGHSGGGHKHKKCHWEAPKCPPVVEKCPPVVYCPPVVEKCPPVVEKCPPAPCRPC